MTDHALTPEALAELEQLRADATPGPWAVAGVDGMGYAVHRGEHDTIALYATRPDAALIAGRQMRDPVMLCGRMFDLAANDEDGTPLVLDRHRLFESSTPLTAPPHPPHRGEQVAGVYGGAVAGAKRLPWESNADVAPRDRYVARYERKGGYVPRSKTVQQRLLGIDWMAIKGMQESIPPAYAQWVGTQLMAHLTQEAAA